MSLTQAELLGHGARMDVHSQPGQPRTPCALGYLAVQCHPGQLLCRAAHQSTLREQVDGNSRVHPAKALRSGQFPDQCRWVFLCPEQHLCPAALTGMGLEVDGQPVPLDRLTKPGRVKPAPRPRSRPNPPPDHQPTTSNCPCTRPGEDHDQRCGPHGAGGGTHHRGGPNLAGDQVHARRRQRPHHPPAMAERDGRCEPKLEASELTCPTASPGLPTETEAH